MLMKRHGRFLAVGVALRVISVACNALTWAYGPLSNTYTIFEGTSEIQRLVIARAISGIHIN